MELMARVVDKAIACGALREEELWLLSEREIIGRWNEMLEARETDASLGTNEAAAFSVSEQSLAMPKNNGQQKSNEARDFLRLYKTYRTMKKVRGSSAPLDGYFCVQLAVKRRWINPLVAAPSSQESVSVASQKVRRVCDVPRRLCGCGVGNRLREVPRRRLHDGPRLVLAVPHGADSFGGGGGNRA